MANPSFPPPLPPELPPAYSPPPPPKQPSLLGKLFAPILILLALAAKFGKILLPALKFLPALLKTGGTMLLSIWVYAMLWGWKFAAGFVLCIFVHELGHVYAARQVGIKNTSVPIFIPFFGALILQREAAKNAWHQAIIGIGGPVAGAWAAAICHYIFLKYDAPLFGGLAYTGYLLNLFNLIPFGQLDGGHITSALTPKFSLVGAVLLGVILFLRPHNFILWFIFLANLTLAFRAFRKNRTPEEERYYSIPSRQRWIMGACYLGLIALLVGGMHLSHERLMAHSQVAEEIQQD